VIALNRAQACVIIEARNPGGHPLAADEALNVPARPG
jgi:hypothetical protein